MDDPNQGSETGGITKDIKFFLSDKGFSPLSDNLYERRIAFEGMTRIEKISIDKNRKFSTSASHCDIGSDGRYENGHYAALNNINNIETIIELLEDDAESIRNQKPSI